MKSLYPFFCFYGGKWRAAKRYPLPIHSTIIEPFAGSAGYSLRYPDRNILLYDIDPIICAVWDYLIRSQPDEIRKLPIDVSHVEEIDAVQEAKWLIGFWFNKGVSRPMLTPSAWMRSGLRPNSFWGETIRERIACQVQTIKHWKVNCASYQEIEDREVTWFVDPPYCGKPGQHYRYKFCDYDALSEWCRTRSGQVLVCEQEGASWLPFEPLAKIKSNPSVRGGSYSDEVFWQNSV